MSNVKDMINYSIAGLKKKDIVKSICKKWVNSFLNHINLLEERLMLKLIYLIMQQKQSNSTSKLAAKSYNNVVKKLCMIN